MLHSEIKEKKIKVIFYCEAQSIFLLLPSSQAVFFSDAKVQNCSQGILPSQVPCCGSFSYHSPLTFCVCVADLIKVSFIPSLHSNSPTVPRKNLLPPSSSFWSRQSTDPSSIVSSFQALPFNRLICVVLILPNHLIANQIDHSQSLSGRSLVFWSLLTPTCY